MTYVADLHLHSPYAMATSRHLNFEVLAKWAKIKGIDLLATADFTHPLWFQETKQKLTDKGNGLYEFDGVSFVLGTEVNCNGQQGGRSRRVHVLILAPGLEIASLITDSLSTKGKLASDGRPTVHLTPRQLLETLLHIDDQIILIPAHVWTPWFGIFGSKSGFDSLEECFGDLKQHVLAIESGLSSDPAMNWQIPDLDNVSIVSFSDAHSAPKLGRELTKFEGELSYQGLFDDIKNQNIHSTMEFFPDEGKYHSTGHRKCGVCWSPEDVRQKGELCTVCGRKLTLGVSHRVDQLAKRHVETWKDEFGFTLAANGRPAFKSVVGLQQIVAEGLRRGVNTKGVTDQYFTLVNEFESELNVLMDADIRDVARLSGERIAEGVSHVRTGNISIQPGFDGQFGKVTVWPI
jgi:uncharacterized protein (TIGR00375 family)